MCAEYVCLSVCTAHLVSLPLSLLCIVELVRELWDHLKKKVGGGVEDVRCMGAVVIWGRREGGRVGGKDEGGWEGGKDEGGREGAPPLPPPH